MTSKVYVFLYLLAIVLANLSVAAFGPPSVIVNAFLFIGLDLVARDKLHDAWRGKNMLLKMIILVSAGSVLSWVMNRDAGSIAIASLVAFSSAAGTDTIVYHLLGRYPRWLRINGSNIPSALVDSVVFPTLAFGSFMWPIVLGQFLAKVLGGFLWSLVFHRFGEREILLRYQ